MGNFLDVTGEHLSSLSSQEAVEFFSELLWTKARSIGLDPDRVNISQSITSPDGGIDAVVNNMAAEQSQGMIHPGVNYYQIKTGNMSPNRRNDVQKILFKPDKTTLHPRIKSCLDRNGSFVVVLFGSDKPPPDMDAASVFKDELRKNYPGYHNPRIEVWQQNQIIGYVQKFLPLQKKLTNTEQFAFRTHKEWYEQSNEMQTTFVSGDAQQGFIGLIRERLKPSASESDIRIVGSPGSGKTRIVYEITNNPELSPSVLYFENPDHINTNNFLGRLLGSDSGAILVVDECSEFDKEKLWDRIAPCSSKIKLITIDNGQRRGQVYELPPLGKKEIAGIFSGYGVPEERSAQYSPWCASSPRLANWLGQNLQKDPNFSMFAKSEIYNRFIAGQLRLDSQEFKDRKTVLMWISMFGKVGINPPYSEESEFLAKKIMQRNGISEGSFFGIVRELREEKILQGHRTVYITPLLVHFWLWSEWWETYGAGFNLDEFLRVDEPTTQPTYFPQSMQKRFFGMFARAPESSNAMEVVRRFLGTGGPLDDGKWLETDVGARFFSALAQAEPRLSLDMLSRTIGKWDRQRLLSFTTGRREVLWTLEDMVREPSNFNAATKILLLLAATENENVANNATGIFTELFALAPRELARTQASIKTRLSLLGKVLDSSDKEERMCALKACSMALESLYFERTDYRQGKILMLKPGSWTPGHKEIRAYQKIIKMISERLEEMENDERQEAINIIITRARTLTRLKPLAQLLTNTIMEISQKPYATTEKIISEIESIIHYDYEILDPTIMDLWKKLGVNLQKDDFRSLMKRYVGMNIHTDDFDENKKRAGMSSVHIKKLAWESIQSKKKLLMELHWICTSEAKNAAKFGFELGQMDAQFSLLHSILRAQAVDEPNYSSSFVGNYLIALFERDVERWEHTLDYMAGDPNLCKRVADVTALSGMTDKAGLRIARLYDKGIIKKSGFAVFVYRARLQELSDAVFLKWAQILLDAADIATLNISLALFEQYYISNNSTHMLPEVATFQLITHDLLLRKSASPEYTVMDKFCWTNIAKKFIEQFPERTLALADIFLKNMRNENNLFSGPNSETLETLDLICASKPVHVWKIIQMYIGPPLDRRAYRILAWMEGFGRIRQASPSFTSIPIEKIFTWIDVDKNKRARHMARFIPKIMFDESGCMVREFLVQYGDREDVRNSLHNHFLSGVRMESGIEYYTKEIEKYVEFEKQEKNLHVLRWIDDHIKILKEETERETAMEERLFDI